MKSQLVERTGSLKLVESKNLRKGCLGRLEGPCADFKNSTRNGRLYGLQLWKNVFNNSIVKESLKTHTLFGELDHPEDRFECLSKYACVCMTDYDIREDEGLVYGGFDILDTPQGRILKSLVDYGSQMGVSSRGEGDIIQGDKGEEVDPDTFEFSCFDVVSTPAVTKARQTVVESVEQGRKKRNLLESIQNEINKSNDIDSLEAIERTVINSNIPNLNKIKRSIKNKKSMIIEGKTISSQKTKNSAVKENTAKTIREDIETANVNLLPELSRKLRAYRLREKRLNKAVNSYKAEISNLTEELSTLRKSLDRINNRRIEVTSDNRKLEEKISRQQNKINLLETKNADKAKRQELTISQTKKQLVQNNRLTEQLQQQVDDLISRNQTLEEQLAESESIIESYKIKQSQLKDSLKEQISNSKVQEKTNCEQEDTIQIQNDNLTRLEESYDILNSNYTDLDNQYADLTNRYNALLEKYNKISDDKDIVVEKLNKSLKLNKQYTNDFLSTYSQSCGVDPKNVILNESITSPNRIKTLVTEAKNKQDRYNKLPISYEKPTEVKILKENISKNNEEDNNLESFLTNVQSYF